MKEIKIETVRKLVPVCAGSVKHFCQTAARLYGKIALREQLAAEDKTGNRTSFQMVEEDRVQLKQQIQRLANECAQTLTRLNAIAQTHHITPLPLSGVTEMGIVDIIKVITIYVETLVAESDYKSWSNDMLRYNEKLDK